LDSESLTTLWEAKMGYERAMNKAQEVVEPYMLSGKASVSELPFGEWFRVKPFPGHLDFYTNDKRGFDSFVSRNLIAFSGLQKDLTDAVEKLTIAERAWEEVKANRGPGVDMISQASRNIKNGIETLETDLDHLRNALEVEINPFYLTV